MTAKKLVEMFCKNFVKFGAHRLGDDDQERLLPVRGGNGITCRAAAEPQACEGNQA